MNTIQKIINKRFQLSIAQIVFNVGILVALSIAAVTFAHWRFNFLDVVKQKIESLSFYLVPADRAPAWTRELVPAIPSAPDMDDVALDAFAVQSRSPQESDLLIALGEDREYLQSILKTIFPDGTAGLSEEQITIEILRYVNSALDLKRNSGNATKILRDGYAICGGMSVSFEALVRLAGIPARRVNMYGLVHQGGHTLVEVHYAGQWHLYDPTFGIFFYSNPEYDKRGVVPSLEELVTKSPEGWYILKAVDQPWEEYDESVRSFDVVRAEEDYLTDFYGYPFLTEYRQMFVTTFPVAYDGNQIRSFPVVVDLTQDSQFSVGGVDSNYRDVSKAITVAETAGKVGMYYLIGNSKRQYLHTWFIKVPSPGLVRITYYSTEDMPPVLMLFPLKAAHVISSSQKDKKTEFLLRVSDQEASVQIWSSNGTFWVDAMQAELVNADSSSVLDK